jgi:hypothetical protein
MASMTSCCAAVRLYLPHLSDDWFRGGTPPLQTEWAMRRFAGIGGQPSRRDTG